MSTSFQWSERKDERDVMVRDQVEARGIHDPAIIAAMRRVPRHLFVEKHLQEDAYRDSPLPIQCDQTISQPYMVALMTSLLRPRPGDCILEIGSGCGYQTAVLLELGVSVFAVELEAELATQARTTLHALGYSNFSIHVGDGSYGWSKNAPYQGILVAAAAPETPEPLLGQLAVQGRLVIPVGQSEQVLLVHEQTDSGISTSEACSVRFVPLRSVRN